MLKSMPIFALAALAVAVPAPAAAVLGPDAASCRAGSNQPAVLVNLSGFKAPTGEVRVQLYTADSNFLAKGKYLRRIELPVTGSGPMRICLAAPAAGQYAVAVRHDVDGNGKSGWNDGGGFSGNPRLSITATKPRPVQVAFNVGNSVKPVDVVMQYRQGLSVGPVARN